MNNPLPESAVLGLPAPRGLGYNGTKDNGDWGAICHEWWLLGVPFSPWWSRGWQAICCVSLVLGTLPMCAMNNANLRLRPLSVPVVGSIFKAGDVLTIFAISSSTAWKKNKPKKVWCTEKCHGDIHCLLVRPKLLGEPLVLGLLQW